MSTDDRAPTKSERREQKRWRRRKMVVTGISTRLLQRIIVERARRLSRKEKNDHKEV